MTVSSLIDYAGPYVADGINRNWDFAFYVEDITHLELKYTDLSGIVHTVPQGEFTVAASGFKNNAGGTIVYPVAPISPLTSGFTVNVQRITPYDQPSALGNQSRFFPQTHEDAINHIVLQAQQLKAKFDAAKALLDGLLELTTTPPGITPASSVSVVPNGDLISTTAQTALEELQAEILGKAASVHTHAQADITNLVADLASKIAISVLAAKGDIMVRDATGPIRLPIGSNGLALMADSAQATGLRWGNTGIASYNVYNTSDTWTKPSNLSSNSLVRIRMWAGGGSGARNTGNAGGGGGGGFVEYWVLASSIGASVTVTIGAGGAAVSANGNGNPGGTTSFGAFTASPGAGGTMGGSPAPGGGGGLQSAGTTAGAPGNPQIGQGWGDVGTDTFADGKRKSGFWHGGGGAMADNGGVYDAGGISTFGGAGGGARSVTTAVSNGGTSRFGGQGGNGGNGVAGGSGTQPGGGGGASSTVSGAGGDGRIEVAVFN